MLTTVFDRTDMDIIPFVDGNFSTEVNLPNAVLSGNVHLFRVMDVLVEVKDQIVKVGLNLCHEKMEHALQVAEGHQYYITDMRGKRTLDKMMTEMKKNSRNFVHWKSGLTP